MNFVNRALTCRDCSLSFVFSAGEQEFFSLKGLSNEPKRCPNCRVMSRLKRNGNEQVATETECADCGAKTLVPFKPTGCKPVFCAACLRTRRSIESEQDARQLVPAG
jgi:CxxC-x17-CxxC domain-containing protein